MISILNDDIFKQEVDAIVNPANTQLLHGGGLAGVIAGLAGEDLTRESGELAPVPTGGAVITTAGNLPFKSVIHAIGPVWGGGDYREAQLLEMAYTSAFREAAAARLRSIALPAISCGVFRYPIEEAAKIALFAANEWDDSPIQDIRFCLVDQVHYQAFIDAAEEAEIPFITG